MSIRSGEDKCKYLYSGITYLGGIGMMLTLQFVAFKAFQPGGSSALLHATQRSSTLGRSDPTVFWGLDQ